MRAELNVNTINLNLNLIILMLAFEALSGRRPWAVTVASGNGSPDFVLIDYLSKLIDKLIKTKLTTCDQ